MVGVSEEIVLEETVVLIDVPVMILTAVILIVVKGTVTGITTIGIGGMVATGTVTLTAVVTAVTTGTAIVEPTDILAAVIVTVGMIAGIETTAVAHITVAMLSLQVTKLLDLGAGAVTGVTTMGLNGELLGRLPLRYYLVFALPSLSIMLCLSFFFYCL